MLRKYCFRSVLNAFNRYNHCSQSLLSTTHRFSSNIVNTTDNRFRDTTGVMHKIKNVIGKREKRLRIFQKTVSDVELDILGEQLIKCTSIPQLLELITTHHSMMNNRHITETFETLLDLLSNSSIDKTQVLSSPEFQLLCSRTMDRIRYFTPSEILTCIKVNIFLNVQTNSETIECLLKMAREMISRFSLFQLVFLDFLLEKISLYTSPERQVKGISNYDNQAIVPLVDALKLALPLVLQVKIVSNELDFDNIGLVIKCLRVSCKHNLKEDVIDRLVAALSFKFDQLSIEECFKIIESLSFLRRKVYTNFGHKLIRDCLSKASKITTSDLLSLKLNYNYIVSLTYFVKDRRLFYHKDLFDLVANFILEYPEKVEVIRTSYLLGSFTHYNHVHYGLFDYISEEICKNEEFINDPKVSIVNILTAFALPANYLQNKPNSSEIYDKIMESPSVNNYRNRENYLLFNILRSFCILGYYPQDLIKDCVFNYLEEAVNNSTSLKVRTELLSYFVPLYQYLNINNINDSNKSMIERLKPYIDEYVLVVFHENKNNSLTNSSLNKFLSEGLGGQQFVANGVFSNFGHYIDHVVVMRKDGSAVDIGNIDKDNICFIKDLSIPIDSKIIGIIGLTFRDYCRHPFVLKGETDYRIKTLKKSGIFPIVINSDSFESLHESERIPFLMKEIQEVLQQSEPQTDNILN